MEAARKEIWRQMTPTEISEHMDRLRIKASLMEESAKAPRDPDLTDEMRVILGFAEPA